MLRKNDQAFTEFLSGNINSYDDETRFITKSGQVRSARVAVRAVWKKDGTPDYFITSIQDITERKQAEEKVRFQAMLLETVGQSVIATDADGKISYWNRASEKLYEWSSQDVLGKNHLDVLLPPEIALYGQQMFNITLLEGKTWTGEIVVQSKSGRKFLAQFTDAPILSVDGETMGMIGISQDITGQVQANELIRRRLKIEEVISRISSRLIRDEDFDRAIEDTLHDIGMFTESERSFLVVLDQDAGEAVNVYEWPQIDLYRETHCVEIPRVCKTWMAALKNGEIVQVPSLNNLADTFMLEKQFLRRTGVFSMIWVPWKHSGGAFGFLGIENIWSKDVWNPDSRAYLEIIAHILGNIFQRRWMMLGLEQRVADRTREIRALYEIAIQAENFQNLQKFILQCLQITLNVLDKSAGSIHLFESWSNMVKLAAQENVPDLPHQEMVLDGSTPWGWVIQSDSPIIVSNVHIDPRTEILSQIGNFSAYLGAPMHVKGELRGVISIYARGEQEFRQEDISLLRTIADRISLSIENTQLRVLARQADIVEERQRLARELHDMVTQHLYSLMLLAAASQKAARQPEGMERIRKNLSKIEEYANMALRQMRLLIFELRPSELTAEGLVGALQRRLDVVEKRSGLTADLTVDQPPSLTPEQELDLYGIAQEALNNALKHSSSSKIHIKIQNINGEVHMDVTDNGAGFELDKATSKGGLGLSSMQERAERIGATLKIYSTLGGGTTVHVCIPGKQG